MNWLVTGGSGQVGAALLAAPPPGVRIIAPPRALLDLADPALDPAPLIALEGITAIISCGAYTQVDRAEADAALAMQVNGSAPGILARAAAAASIPIVHVSTDYVFAGDKPAPYGEDDPTGPRTSYGRSKLAGEEAVSASGARHAIVRTAWVFSDHGQNFVKTMLRLGQSRDELGVVADQYGSPTHAGDLAAALAVIATALELGKGDSGIWHVTNVGETDWHGFATRIFARAAINGRRAPKVNAITTADYPTPAARPVNSRLSTARVARDFGLTLRPWQEASDAVVDLLCAADQGSPA